MLEQAGADLRVALGLLDLRHLAGDPNLTLRLRSDVLAHWRRTARDRLPALRDAGRASGTTLVGELAHLSVPDLKEAEGGLRDATVLKALVATWLVDVPHVDLERSRLRAARRPRRRCTTSPAGPPTGSRPSCGTTSPSGSGWPTTAAAQRHVRELGRRITHLSRLTWRRVDGVLARPAPRTAYAARSWMPVAPGVALVGRRGRARPAAPVPADDPTLLLRAAAVAAERDVVLAPATAARLVREGAALPEPVAGRGARRLFVRLLAAGPRAAAGLGDPRGDRRAGDVSCPSGSGSGCCRTRRRSTGSPSTGTSSRPASRRPR